MSCTRTRLAALAGSVAFSLTLVSTPAVLAQDGPEATVEALLGAIEAKDFEALPTFFCAEFADQASALDFHSMVEGILPGMDASALLDAFILDTEITSLDVLSQSDTEATVKLEGSISMEVDFEALGELFGLEITPEMLELLVGPELLEAELTEISEELTLIPGEAMPWVVCSELRAAAGGLDDGTADASSAPVESIAPEVTEEEAAEGE